MQLRISVGLASGNPHDPVLEDASAALRISKTRGKHRFTEVDDALRKELRHARRLGPQLADAVARKEIELWAQPIMKIDNDGEPIVHSYECLARWTSPDGEQVSPAVFIPMIEEQRLTRELGEHVITQAVAFLASLDPPVGVAVNISASHFMSAGFAEFVHASIARAGVEPHRLTIEITESEQVALDEACLTVARHVRAAGVGLAIDDFGTGYASLERLLQFPCTQLKLDRLLVENAEGTSLENLLSGFGDIASHMEVIAEGVETESQLAMLRRHGVPFAQGYFFAHPGPLSDIQRRCLVVDGLESSAVCGHNPAGSEPSAGDRRPFGPARPIYGPILSKPR